MRFFILALAMLLGGCASVERPKIPTPWLAVSFSFERDPGWNVVEARGSETAVVRRYLRDGDTLDAWDELVSLETALIRSDLHSFVENFQAVRSDPNVASTAEASSRGSMIVRYESPLSDELSIRRFFAGPDGIYMLAYHVRLSLADPERLQIWNTILAEAVLVENPLFGFLQPEDVPLDAAMTMTEPCRFIGTLHRRSRVQLDLLRKAQRIDTNECRCATTKLATIDRQFTAACPDVPVAYVDVKAAQRAAYESCWGANRPLDTEDALDITR